MAATIHSTALVHASAELDADVVIGPYTVIGPDVCIGHGTHIGAHCVIEGKTTIGSDNRIFHFVSLARGQATLLIETRLSVKINCCD